jgi:hypothetical protein
MKNKSLYLIILLAGVVLFGLFTAGSWNKVQIPCPIGAVESDTINIKVILSENNGENPIVYYFKLSKDTNYTLLELMERKFVVEQENGFITSIQGRAASTKERTAWMYEINGQMAMVGAADYRIKDGDVYHWDLRKW